MTVLLAMLAQIDWKDALPEKGDRPILWYVHTVRGTKMDRKDVVDDYMKYGPWMMPDVVDLVKRRFTAVRAPARGEHDIKPLDFIEPGIVFLAPDGKLLHKIDRISTFQEDWLVDLLRGVLAKWGKPEPPYRLEDAKTPVERARLLRKMRKPDEALKEADDFERGMILLRLAKWRDAVDAFAKVDTPDAHYLRGAALFCLNQDGREAWRKSGSEKAKAELAGRGPFFRCFEELEYVPAPDGLPGSTTRPSKELDAKRCVAFLLRTQRANGCWNDSNYVFGGEDSLPNVYMAGTALACAALLAWRDVDPKGVDAAIDRALPYLADEKNIAADDADEIIWAHAYRLYFYARKPDVKKMDEIVGAVERLQKKSGIWQHEYNAPFTTATVLHCLWEAKQAGATVPDAMMKKGAEALATCRSDKGVFSYGYPGRGGAVQGAAGRMAVCELALLLCGESKEPALRAAVDAGFEHHALLEKVRKYDDHADRWRNGGFFFWYDMLGRAEAIRRLKDGAKLLEKQRGIALSITEIDGCFVDSHELGKTYGTAMGLLVMKLCSK